MPTACIPCRDDDQRARRSGRRQDDVSKAPLSETISNAMRMGPVITGLLSGRHHDKTGAWEMHTDLSDRGIAASDDDLMDARGDQLADDRVAPGIIRRDGHSLTR